MKRRHYPHLENVSSRPPAWLCKWAILAPKNETVSQLNSRLLQKIHILEIVYRSIDSTTDLDQAIHYLGAFLNLPETPEMPHQNLILKVGALIMLLRNLDAPKLCNGTRLQVIHLKKHRIEGIILTRYTKGKTVFIPRILIIPTDYPFKFKKL